MDLEEVQEVAKEVGINGTILSDSLYVFQGGVLVYQTTYATHDVLVVKANLQDYHAIMSFKMKFNIFEK